MWVEEVDVRREPGRSVMTELRIAFNFEMKIRYPDADADYGPHALPDGMYRPAGCFLILHDRGNAVGCVGLRKLPDAFATNIRLSTHDAEVSAEGKSLFIVPKARNRTGASLLMLGPVEAAVERGYKWLYGNTGRNQSESVRVLRSISNEIPLSDRSNPLAAYAFRLDL